MPNFNLNYGGSQKVESYLHQLNEQLRYILNNLDGENFSPVYLKTVEKTQSLAELTSEAVNNLQEGVEVDYKELSDKIISQAEKVNQTFDEVFEVKDGMIISKVDEKLLAKVGQDQLEASFSSCLAQSSETIDLKFTESYDFAANVDGNLNSFKNLIETYFEFSTDGLRLRKTEKADESTEGENESIEGEEESEKDLFEALLSEKSIVFYRNNAEIASIKNGKMYIRDAEILNSIIMGNWVENLKGNKNKSLRWVD